MIKSNTSQFIENSNKIHNNEYDYSLVNYINNKTKVKIICKNHGAFEQIPGNHLVGQGCKKCKIKYFSELTKLGCDLFIKKSNIIHDNRYDYSLVIYHNTRTLVNIKCHIHGEFFQTPNSHLNGSGCPKCGKLKSSKKLSILYTQTYEEFLKKSNDVHDDKYDYSKSVYINDRTKIEIICKKHGSFWQVPNSHLQGRGCPKCTSKISKPEIKFLNYLKVPDTLENRQKRINKYIIDGIKNNKIYEFLGDYFHGNPVKYNTHDYNQICHKTFGQLYNQTEKKFKLLKECGYNVYYIWESDWNSWLKDKSKRNSIPIKKYKMGENL